MIVAFRGNYRVPWCTENHVAASLEELGHKVIRLQEDTEPWENCVNAARRAHFFMWTRTWQIDVEGGFKALEAMRADGIPTVSFHLDRYIGLDREAQIPDDPFWRTDYVFTADGGNDDKFAHYGVNHHWLPPAVYGTEAARGGKPNRRVFPHKVVFVGSHPYPHAEWRVYRNELIARLTDRFGSDFGVYPRGRAVRGRQLNDLYASAVVAVGDSCLSPDPAPLSGDIHAPEAYWSDRVPETVGRGGLLIHPEVVGLSDWYTHGEHLLTYKLGDFDDLLGKVEWMLADADANSQIRNAGQTLVLGRDTYAHRMQTVIETVTAGGLHAPPPSTTTKVARYAQISRPVPIHVREGHPTDSQVVDEVWTDRTYPIDRQQVAGKVVVDVGANIGAFSVLAASLGAAQVHAYEPEPGNLDVLRQNVGHLPVVVHETALGGATGDVSLVPGPDGAHGGGTHVVTLEEDEPGVFRVSMITPAEALPAGPIGLMKLDAESAEYPIVAAMGAAEFERIERIYGEWHGPVMPHLADRWPSDEAFMVEWSAFVAKLADFGRLELFGHPRAGGTFRWIRY